MHENENLHDQLFAEIEELNGTFNRAVFIILGLADMGVSDDELPMMDLRSIPHTVCKKVFAACQEMLRWYAVELVQINEKLIQMSSFTPEAIRALKPKQRQRIAELDAYRSYLIEHLEQRTDLKAHKVFGQKTPKVATTFSRKQAQKAYQRMIRHATKKLPWRLAVRLKMQREGRLQ